MKTRALVVGGLILCMLASVLMMLSFLRDLAARTGPPAAAASPSLPVISGVPEFSLTNSFAGTFNSRELDGKVWVADFVFSSCATMCPAMMSAMAELQGALPDAERLNFVSISVNPAYDTPEVMAEFGRKYGADTNRWHLLTGPLETIADISLNALKIGNKDNPIDHSSRMVLIDRQARIRGYYDAMDPPALVRLKHDIQALLDAPDA